MDRSKRLYEVNRLKVMIKLTQRAIGNNPMPSQYFLIDQLVRLTARLKEFEDVKPTKKKLTKRKK